MFAVDYLGIEKLLVQFPAQLRLFVVGIILYVTFSKLNNRNIYILLFISLVVFFVFKDLSYFKYSMYPLCIGIWVVYLVYFVKYIKINFDFSYSFYILHFPVIQLALYFGINPIVSFPFLFAVILILSYFSEKYIEKRFIKIGREIVKKDKSA